jgi:outer membrane usher protein
MARSARRFRVDRAASLFALAGALWLQVVAAAAQLAPIQSDPTLISAPRPLRLEVFINGVSTHYVEPFVLTPPDRLSIARGDLEDVGVKVPGSGGLKDMVALDGLGLKFRYDEAAQTIDFTLSDRERLARIYDARGNLEKPPAPTADWGAIVNYTLFGATMNTVPSFPRFEGANATFDARAFGPLGTLSQTAIAGDTLYNDNQFLRLDSTYTYSNPDAMQTWRAGDTISGGLNWTRPIRLGGLQWQSDFTLRSNLVTQPMPVINGSAAVPSTVDVFVNNIKAFSQPVEPGPYQIVNLPALAAGGNAQVVVTDASGRQVQSSMPFFAAPTLLAKGLTDFSVEAGFARRNYALLSDDYDNRPIGSATVRRGLTDWLTLEGHAEGGSGLINGGFGAAGRLGPWGVLEGAGAFSHYSGAMGYQAYADYNLEFRGFTLNMSTQRTFSAYQDLASVTATQSQYSALNLPTLVPYGVAAAGWDPRPPKALDQVTVSAPFPLLDRAALSASFINLVEADNTHSRLVAASYTQPLPRNASFFATAFVDLADHHNAGIFAGLSIPIGEDITASVGVNETPGLGVDVTTQAQKTLQPQIGSYGWNVRDTEGVSPYRAADVSYRSSYGAIDAGVQQFNGQVSETAQFDGSIAFLGGGLFLGNRVHDSFAVVNTGVPNVAVTKDNQTIGTTTPWGSLLIPDLRSYQVNRIGIDPSALPMTGEADSTLKVVAPTRQSGLYLDFGVKKDVRGAIVILNGPDGKPIPAGAKGRLDGSDDTFLIGYDGQAYIKNLSDQNTVTVDNGDKDCKATFSYQFEQGKRQTVGPITCQ